MARIRSLKPDFWLDRKLARRLTRDERMLYMGLWNQADEHARALGDPVVIKGAVFPYDDDLTVNAIDLMLTQLDRAGVVQRYDVDGDPFLFLPKLADHQRLEPAKSKSKHPIPPAQVFSEESEQTGESATIFSESSGSEALKSDCGMGTFDPDQHKEGVQRPAANVSDESAQDRGKSALLYGTGVMEQGGAAQTDLRAADPPPRHCPKHPGGTLDRCGPCADARRTREHFDAEEVRLRMAERAAETRRQAEVRAVAIGNCALCDDAGYLNGRVCDHDPEAVERNRRGIEAAKAALAQAKAAKS